MKITLDPGHGRYDNRGIDTSYLEGTKMFILAGFLKQELMKYNGCEVFITRNRLEDNPSLYQRGKMAIDSGSDVFISLHSNAASSARACGVSMFYSVFRDESTSLGDKLGAAVVELMKKTTGITYMRGLKTRTQTASSGNIEDYYGVIRSASKGKDVKYIYIIEHGFHTNETECAFLINENNLRNIAKAEAAVLADYFGLLPYVMPDTVYTVKKGDTLYSIARRFNSTVNALVQYNGIENKNLIYPGQQIKIPPASAKGDFKVGDRVRIKEDKKTYFPNGNEFSDWVHDYDYIIAKTGNSNGEPVTRNGALCVLLGEKINRKTSKKEEAILSWCAEEYLNKID